MSAEAEAIVTTAAADMSSPRKPVAVEPVAADTTPDNVPVVAAVSTEETSGQVEQERAEKILKAKELFSQGSRNFLVKSYDEAADDLSQVCQLYAEVYGDLADELGQPLLLYGKALIAMALDENKVIDVPDEAADEEDEDIDDDDEEEEEGGEDGEAKKGEADANGASSTNGKELDSVKETSDEADSTDDQVQPNGEDAKKKAPTEVNEVSSSIGGGTTAVNDDERPSTSNGGEVTASCSNGAGAAATGEEEGGEDEEGVSGSLQLAWEILGTAARIFSRQGLGGLQYLAEVQTELANIEFENGILEPAREDYEKALKIHGELPTKNRRALAELHYKIGLTYLMQQMNKEGATALRHSSTLIEEEIAEIKAKDEPSERDRNNMLDLEETKQEILAKIQEIEEMQAQTIAEVRAALDSYIRPVSSDDAAAASSSSTSTNGAASSSSSSTSGGAKAAGSSPAISSSSAKPTDITHLIKRKKPEEPSSEAEALCSPAKRPAV
ncbi:nuclear autoantigenic sperm protein homolog [Drosophila kikkawai]|uniref:Nuclear autoantigenic sperm protein homolog n=1 Tax=Drosophila kikkawai TaxID=30033 RepID=A0A6P4JPL7_DROKI|nr:protein NASP homolog [Drosophila kikkawai]KAH8340951.1 hypothetical protein KR059_010398 [Drosophila kikkawai]